MGEASFRRGSGRCGSVVIETGYERIHINMWRSAKGVCSGMLSPRAHLAHGPQAVGSRVQLSIAEPLLPYSIDVFLNSRD